MSTRDRRQGLGDEPLDLEADLIARARAGERRAEIEIYRSHRRAVAANLYRVIGRADELEDLVQEVFVIAFRGLDRFRGESRLSTWLYRISIHVALGALRRRKRKPPPIPVGDPVVPGADEVDAYRQLASAEDRALCYRAMDAMSPKKRIILYLHEIEGHDLKSIAALVGAHPVTVRTRLYYARREFHRRVAELLAAAEVR